MAETSRPPTLPSTADTTPYAPVSWLAVAAMAVAALFAILLLFAGYGAFKEKRPLIQEWLLALPVAAIVFSFAARRVIRNSEGTRTGVLFGIDLPNTAWWLALVLMLGYGAYLFAIDVAIRRDARAEVERWVTLIVEDKVPQAFNRTLPPGGRKDEARLLAQHREELLFFRQSDLVRVAVRNKGNVTFEPGGMREWQYRGGGIDCVFTGTLKCPEGSFPFHVALKGGEGVAGAEGAGAGRQWQLIANNTGYLQGPGSRTAYGYYVAELERKGSEFGAGFVTILMTRPMDRYLVYKGFVTPDGDPLTSFRVYETSQTRAAVGGVIAEFFGPPHDTHQKYIADVKERLYRLPGGAAPTGSQRDQFMAVWERSGILSPGSRLRNNPETTALINVTDTAVEVRLPVELLIPGEDMTAARGKLVLATTDAAVLSELKQLRAAADPDKPSNKPDEFRDRSPRWRVVGIESDLIKVQQIRGSDPNVMPPG